MCGTLRTQKVAPHLGIGEKCGKFSQRIKMDSMHLTGSCSKVVSTAPQGGATFFFFARFWFPWGMEPVGAILWGTLRTQKAVPHLGVDENVKIGTKMLGKHRNST